MTGDIVYGGYVDKSPYKEMRLRMMLTGTSGPTEEQWSDALTRLLNHLNDHPIDFDWKNLFV